MPDLDWYLKQISLLVEETKSNYNNKIFDSAHTIRQGLYVDIWARFPSRFHFWE